MKIEPRNSGRQNYLKARDINEDCRATIVQFGTKEMKNKFKGGVMEEKMTVDLQLADDPDTPHTLILTNAQAENIVRVLGESDTDLWVGKVLVLFPTQIKVAGRIHDVIRFKKVEGE
jgi:hypothetical protein